MSCDSSHDPVTLQHQKNAQGGWTVQSCQISFLWSGYVAIRSINAIIMALPAVIVLLRECLGTCLHG